MRVPVLMRHRAHARLLTFDDPLWRGPIHTGEKSGDGAFAIDPHTVPGRFVVTGSSPRFGRRAAIVATGSREGGSVLYEHTRRAAHGAAHPRPSAQRYETDHHDYRWQTLGADPRRRTHLQERFRPGSAGRQPDPRRGVTLQTRRSDD